MANTTTLPIWLGPVSLEDCGGGVNKRNAVDQAVVNPETDIDVTQYNALTSAIEACSRTVEFARLKATLDATTPTVDSYRANHATGASNAPTLTRVSTGYFRFTWATTYVDKFDQEAAINLIDHLIQVHGTTPLVAQGVFTNAYTLEVRTWNMSSTLVDDAEVTISVSISS